MPAMKDKQRIELHLEGCTTDLGCNVATGYSHQHPGGRVAVASMGRGGGGFVKRCRMESRAAEEMLMQF